MYVSTAALLSKCGMDFRMPELSSERFGREDQIRRVVEVDRQASAMAFPWAVSVSAEAESQTVGREC
jgi:hypothetical protein